MQQVVFIKSGSRKKCCYSILHISQQSKETHSNYSIYLYKLQGSISYCTDSVFSDNYLFQLKFCSINTVTYYVLPH